nr:MAG TPA: hypothetical protein [Caudoviricetes sp.]
MRISDFSLCFSSFAKVVKKSKKLTSEVVGYSDR